MAKCQSVERNWIPSKVLTVFVIKHNGGAKKDHKTQWEERTRTQLQDAAFGVKDEQQLG